MARKRSSKSGVTRVANWTVRPVRRAVRPSRRRVPCLIRGDATAATGSAGGPGGRGDGGAAISGASRLLLASASDGGAPSVLRRLSFERSAILLHLVDQGLNE